MNIPTMLQTVLGVTTAEEARRYFLKGGYFGDGFTFELPGYYKVTGLDQVSLEEIDWSRSLPKVTYPISLTQPKGNYGVRQFDIVHPYAYVHLVGVVTQESSWNRLVNSIIADSRVNVYSLPYLGLVGKDLYTRAIRKFNEADIIADATGFEVLAKSDISNFYKSVYSHSLSWLIHGKTLAQRNRNNYSLLGNRLDKVMQNAMSGQTNGLPIGPITSAFVAELLLAQIDKKLSPYLRSFGIEAFRFKDDYRFLCRSEVDARKILAVLGSLLNSEFNLTINQEKSTICRNPINASIRLPHSNNPAIYNSIQLLERDRAISSNGLTELLINIHSCKSFDRVFIKNVLSKIMPNDESNPVTIGVTEEDLSVQVSILLSIINNCGEVSPQIFALIDKLLTVLDSEEIAANIVRKIYANTQFNSNSVGEIWLHRLANRWSLEVKTEIENESNNPLIRVVSNNDAPHYTFFEDARLSEHDRRELEHFKFFEDDVYQASRKQELEKEPSLWSDYDY